jgi:hypothetical protein
MVPSLDSASLTTGLFRNLDEDGFSLRSETLMGMVPSLCSGTLMEMVSSRCSETLMEMAPSMGSGALKG